MFNHQWLARVLQSPATIKHIAANVHAAGPDWLVAFWHVIARVVPAALCKEIMDTVPLVLTDQLTLVPSSHKSLSRCARCF